MIAITTTHRPKANIGILEPEEPIKALTPSENEVRSAMIQSETNKRLGDMSAPELLALTAQVIKTAYTRLGLKQNSLDMDDLQQVIFFDLRGFLHLNSNEVLFALKSGLNGDYSGENGVFFNSSNFVQWIKKYISGKRREVTRKLILLKERTEHAPTPPLSDEELKKKLIEVTNQYADMIEENPKFEFIAPVWMLFEDLERLGVCSISNEQKRAIYDHVAGLPQNKSLSPDSLKKQARNIAYYRICKELVETKTRLLNQGITLKPI